MPGRALTFDAMEPPDEQVSQEVLTIRREAWRTRAVAQGLFCFVCGEVPSLERRDQYYDTGLCDGCASSLRPPGAPVPGIG